jgi:peptide methionine sulfoxide reductase msrA/msrB
MIKKSDKSDKEWKEVLTPEQYRIIRKGGTERPFAGKYNDHYEKGTYVCVGCGTPLFRSETKYDHGTGWPSFSAPADAGNLEYRDDYSLFMKRIEVKCAVCGAHLGHVFDDGPAPTYQHYCINSVSLDFKPSATDSVSPDKSFPPAGSDNTSSVNLTLNQVATSANSSQSELAIKTETATFAAGCFWGVEYKFRQIDGVLDSVVGFTGGHTKNPTYEQVCTDRTGHAEAIQITYDPAQVSYDKLLKFLFSMHDPTQLNSQGPDIGSQYRSAIFYHNEAQKNAAQKMIEELKKSGRFRKPIATQLVPASEFYKAEDYHQRYYEKHKIRFCGY